MGAPSTFNVDAPDDLKKNQGNDTLATYLSLVQQYLAVFRVDNATWLAERAVADYPDSSEAVYLLALCHFRSCKPRQARQILSQTGTNCTSSMAYLSAQCSFQLKEYVRAEDSLLKGTRLVFKQQQTAVSMDDWILNTTPCPVPNGAAGLALLGDICRMSDRKDRATKYYRMALKLDPFLWTCFEALADMGVENVDPQEVFGVSTKATLQTNVMASSKTPLQPMETPSATLGVRERLRNVQFETPNLTPIPVNMSLIPAETPGRPENMSTLRRAKDVASRQYYPPSPDTPVTTVSRSMRYLRGLGGLEDSSRGLFASENQTANRTAMTAIASINEDPSKPERDSKVQDILEILCTAGVSYQRLRMYRCKEALIALQQLPTKQQMTSWVLEQQGRAYLEMNDFQAARRCLEQMHQQDPGRLKGLELLSTVYWQLKKEVELATLAQQAVDWDRLSPESWCVVGNCFSLQKDHQAALMYFRRSLQIDPLFTYTHTLSGYEYMANEDFDKAVSCFRQALRTNENHYNAWYGLGAIYHRQEKFDLAEYHFQRAVKLHPTSGVLRCNLGIAKYANGKAYQALDTLSEALRLDPTNPQARFQRATIYSALHRPEEALDELRKVRDAAPKEATVHFAMGKVLKRLGRQEEALKCFLTAMDLDPKDNKMIKSAMDKLNEPDVDEESMAAY